MTSANPQFDNETQASLSHILIFHFSTVITMFQKIQIQDSIQKIYF